MFWVANATYGQGQKHGLQVSEYNQWSTLQNENIAPNGNWIAYSLHYEEEVPDTLFVKNVKTGREFIVPNAAAATFSGDSRVVAVKLENGILLRELNGSKAQTIENVAHFEFYAKAPYLILLTKKDNKEALQILNYNTQQRFDFPAVKSFSCSADGRIALSTGTKVSIINPEKQWAETVVVESSLGGFKGLQWNKTANRLAFLQQLPKDSLTQNHKIHCYDMEKAQLYTLNPDTNPALEGQRIIARLGTPPLGFTKDGRQLFFAAANPRKPVMDEKVEVWDSATHLEYTPNRYNGDNTYEPKLQRWEVDTGEIKAVGTYNHPKVMGIDNPSYALCYNPLQYEPQYAYFAPADIYLKNIETGTETLLLKKYPVNNGTIGNSPNGRFIHYFSEGSWYVYDIYKAVQTNISKYAKTQFEHSGKSDRGRSKAFGCAGWTTDSQYLIVYDEYGIWKFSNDGKSAQRLVDGAKDKIKYRVYKKVYESGEKISVDEFRNYSFDLSKGLVLEALGDDMQSGYFIVQPDGALKKLIYEAAGSDRLLKAKETEEYLCVRQTVVVSPELVLINKAGAKTVAKTNSQMQKYPWGSASLINYKNKEGVPLKGILYKPAGFVTGKKYPMIVSIYEKQSQGLHTYYNPTLHDVVGFTPVNYFLDGYLVLLPDIVYQQGNPGLSAVDCVESAVSAVKQLGIVDENHIGLIGHSFGGFETSFIITQTNTFAAAVSGSGVMDLIGSYFTHTSIGPRSNTWRYEEQQFRMSCSPFEDWEAYERNSPLKQAAGITTPLLSWAGKKDPNVLWTQSATFHLALRRLGKRNVFLVYPMEEHTITDSEMQKDITKRTKNWFDFYLKGKTEALTQGVP